MPNIAKIEISEINRLARTDPRELIRRSEERYKNFTDEIATRVAENENIRIILLAGPSGSGKTTTANLLADGIRKKGLFSTVISLDDFYRDSTDPRYPRLPNGKRKKFNVYAETRDQCETKLAEMIAQKKAEIAEEKAKQKEGAD